MGNSAVAEIGYQPSILAERIMRRTELLAECSESADHLTRTYLSYAMHGTHEWLRMWLTPLGFTIKIDAVGNFIARREGITPGLPALVIGSHLDTVPNGGKWDGQLGVLLGVAVAEALRGQRLPFALEIVGFSEEEGVRFATPFIGSRAYAGDFAPSLLDLADNKGKTVRDAIESFGLHPDSIPTAARKSGEILAYIEPHIEQGPVLERANTAVGIVTSIAAQRKLRMQFVGESGHAGTVPMEGRRDALAAMAEWVLEVERIGAAASPLVATVGMVQNTPNVTNVIAGTVLTSVDVRHPDDAVCDAALEEILAAAEAIAARRNVEFSVLSRSNQATSPCAPELCNLLKRSFAENGLPIVELASGAGHDAMIVSKIAPTAMLFIRCDRGISHHPAESVTVEDVDTSLSVLMSFVRGLAAKHAASVGVAK